MSDPLTIPGKKICIQKRSVSVILPAFNEESNLNATVEDALAVLPKHFNDFEIIIVNDGSRDGTAKVCQSLKNRCPSLIRIIHHQENRGYGIALRSGFVAAEKNLIFFTDSDGQFHFDGISEFVNKIKNHDMVLGYRAKRQDPWFRRLNSKIGNFLARLILGIQVKDINCAFKLIHRKSLQNLSLESEGALINTELLAYATKARWSFLELPVKHFPRKHGKPTGGNFFIIIKTFNEYFKLRKRLV